jgi:uncharacterized damage-inducible protein DinB
MTATDTLINELERTRDEVLGHFSLGSGDLARTYGPGKWSVRYILNHLADSELVFTERLRRAISEPGAVAWYYDQDLWSRALDYSTRSLEVSKTMFEALRNAIIVDVRRHYERNGAIKFVHSKAGLRTVKEEYDHIVSHTENHLGQVRQALAMR